MSSTQNSAEWPRTARYAVVADLGGISAVVYAETPSVMRRTTREFMEVVCGDLHVTAYDEQGQVVMFSYRETRETRH